MNFINKIASFVVCIFVAQTSLGFAESHVDHNENDFQKNFEDATTCWLRALLKKSLQEAIYDDLEEVITQDELLSMFQDSDFQSKLRTHFQKMLQDFVPQTTLQEDELEPQLRSTLQSALQNTFLDEFLESFFTGMQNAFEEKADDEDFAFSNEIQSIIQDPEFKQDILAVIQDPVIQVALQTNLQDLEFQRALQNSLQSDELLHSMIQLQFQSVIQEDRLLSVIQNVLQDPRWPVIVK
ncbi:hypothetical protein [Candidatus Rhabdochlamydia sp. T3358]|uniref:hypothetical protein n=1 Tax=Candidatus Rhabdochlamydia sp. T3358 TaxID=2099795 RepID=UPI0010B7A06B|nr:hypothetical protein [Candidatus Rhabdochlamydia sp. T3358]VHO03643.1 hypothetical protein RHT_01000 [Candidatus Rhabdochlamydia sp. T3358]